MSHSPHLNAFVWIIQRQISHFRTPAVTQYSHAEKFPSLFASVLMLATFSSAAGGATLVRKRRLVLLALRVRREPRWICDFALEKVWNEDSIFMVFLRRGEDVSSLNFMRRECEYLCRTGNQHQPWEIMKARHTIDYKDGVFCVFRARWDLVCLATWFSFWNRRGWPLTSLQSSDLFVLSLGLIAMSDDRGGGVLRIHASANCLSSMSNQYARAASFANIRRDDDISRYYKFY